MEEQQVIVSTAPRIEQYQIMILDQNRFAADLFAKGIKKSSTQDPHRYGKRLKLGTFLKPDELRATLKTERCDLLIMDLNTANETGISFIESLRADNHQFPIIAISKDRTLSSQAREAGATGFLTKPVKNSKLCEVVSLHLN